MKKLNSLLLIVSLTIIFILTNIHTQAATIISNRTGNWNSLNTWYVDLVGTINATTTSNMVTGNGTTFTTQLQVGTPIIDIIGTVIGTVASIQSNTQLTLTSNATANMSSANTVRFQKIPTTADDVRIINHTITVDANAVCNTLQVSGTGTSAANLNFNTDISLNVTGATTMSTPPGNAFYTINVNNGDFTTGSMVLGGSNSNRMSIVNVGSAGNFDCLGNVTFNASGTTNGTRFTFSDFLGGSMTFRGNIVNFQLTQTGLSTVKYLGIGTQTVRTATYGTLVLSGGTKTFQASVNVSNVIEFIGLVTLSGTYTPGSSILFKYTNVNGTITDAMWPVSTITSAGVEINTTGTTTLNNAKTISGGGINVIAGNLNTNNFAVSIGGNLSIGAGASIIGGSSNFTFTGGFNQSISGFTTTGSINITKSAGTATFTGNVVAGPLVVNASSTGRLSFGTGTNLQFTNFSNASGSTILGGSNNNVAFSGTFSNLGTLTPETGTIELNGTAQTASGIDFYNIILSNSGAKSVSDASFNNFTMKGSASISLTSSTTINNNFSLLNTSQLTTNGKNFTVNGVSDIDGTLNISSFISTINLKHVYIAATGTFSNSINNPISISGDLYNFGTFTSGTGNYTLSGAGFQLTGNLSINNLIISGTYFNEGTLTVSTSLSGVGTLNNNANGIININTSTAPTVTTVNFGVVGNTVNYSLAGNQTLRNTTYHHLNLTNSGTKNLPAGTISINGNLTISGTVSTQLVAATVIGGNLTLQNTASFNTSTQNLTVNGNISNVAGSTLTWGSGIITLAGSTQNVSNGNGAFTINNLVLSGGEKTFANNLTNGTAFTINAGAKFVFGTSTSLTLNGSIAGTGTIKAKACGGANNTLTIGGTSNGNAIQLENGFHHLSALIVNKTSGIIIINDDIAISTTFTLPTTGTAQITFNQDLNLYGTVAITSGSVKINMGPNSSISIGNCVLTGTTFTIPSNIFNGNPTIAGLYLNRTNGLTLGNQMISVSDIVQITAGNFSTNNNLTLLSTASKTARVAPIPAGITVTGDVIAQRFIPGGNGKRKWRFLSSPVNVSGSIALTQFQDDIFVTAPAEAAGGFDVNPFSNNASLRTYDETQAGSSSNGWTDPTNINNTISTGQGVEVFVRGSRNLANPYLNWTVPDDVTIDYVGALNTGNIVRNLSFTNTGAGTSDGFNLVGNPYASPINFDTVGLVKVNIENKFWTYNPNTTLYGSYNAANGESINGMGKYISSGQAFFVRTTAAGASISFTENCKSLNLGSNFFRGLENSSSQGKYPSMKISLTNSYGESDETLLIHDNQASKNGNDETDTYKFFNDELNIYFIADDNTRLSMQAIPFSGPNDTSKLAVWSFDSTSVSVAKHKIEFSRIESIKPSIHVYLRDKFLNKMIDVRQQPTYEFEISTNTNSYGNNRFEVILSTELLTSVSNESKSKVVIYPNPFSNEINMIINTEWIGKELEYTLFDLSGRMILRKKTVPDHEQLKIETDVLSRGHYILKIIGNSEVITEKIIKQ